MIRKAAYSMIFGVLAIGVAGTTMAAEHDTQWDARHPRRDEVNDRLHKQDRRIHDEVREGEMSRGKAAALHRKDARIRQEERDMAARNGGHVTRGEQAVLNRQENQVSRQIGK